MPTKFELLMRYLLLQQRFSLRPSPGGPQSAAADLQAMLQQASEPAPLLPAVGAFPVQACPVR